MLSVKVPLIDDRFIVDISVSFENVELQCKALVDTGATSSAIKPNILEKLGAVSRGNEYIYTANGIKKSKIYKVAINVIFSEKYSVGGVYSVSTIKTQDKGFDILLGMDVLRNFYSACITNYGNMLVLKSKKL